MPGSPTELPSGHPGLPLPGIGASRDLEGERRVITILFCDVHGSTALAEQLDPEEWAEIMNAAFKHLIGPINRYGGTVARLMGDAVLAFFGAPLAHEDDPQRAVLAGLDIVSGISTFRQQLEGERQLDFNVRVGINTGLVVVAEIGSGGDVEYTAMGDAVNVASRMEQTAAPGTVQISEDTYRIVAPYFEVEALGEIEVKGKRQPVRSYRVLRLKGQAVGARARSAMSSPLVGRSAEMQHLHETLELVRQGRGQIVCLIGEAGIGKSRLISELYSHWRELERDTGAAEQAKDISRQVTTWHESRSISYATSLPYGTFQQLIRGLCGAAADDPPDLLREKISCECLSSTAPNDLCVRVSRAFEVLMGVEQNPGETRLEGEAFKRELFDAMTATWRDWAGHAPCVLVFDDLHWADRASVDLLVHLFRLVEEVPLLFLCAFRPDRASAIWEIKQVADREYPHRYTEINLAPLSSEDSELLMNNLISFTGLPAVLRGRILHKSEGNPFFIEQIMQSLIETGVVVRDGQNSQQPGEISWQLVGPAQEIVIPDTVQALLQSRIDRLAEDVRQSLQMASVVGRTFLYSILKNITGNGSELERHLLTLEKVDLIRESARHPELEYSFRHALAQETVYKSILRKRRKQYHLKVAEALEQLFTDRVEETTPLLAHHLYEAGDPRAQRYLTLAADAAFRLYANAEAVIHYTRALELARKNQDYPALMHLYTRRGRALELSVEYDKALSNYLEMESVASELGDQQLLLAAILLRATLLSIPSPVSDADLARSLLDSALNLAQGLGDKEAEARILWNLLLLSERFGSPVDALAYGEKSVALARELGLREQLAFTLNDIGSTYVVMGELQKARQTAAEARQIWVELDNKPMLADNYAASSFYEYLTGNFDQAIQDSAEGLRISHSIGNLWGQAYSQLYVGNVYFDRGEPDKAIHAMQESVRLSEESGFVVPQAFNRVELGLVYAYLGVVDVAMELVRLGLDRKEHIPSWFEPWLYSESARSCLYIGDLRMAEDLLEEINPVVHHMHVPGIIVGYNSLAKAQLFTHKGEYDRVLALVEPLLRFPEWSVRVFHGEALFYQGNAFLNLGRLNEAREALRAGRAECEQLNFRRILWAILAALAEVETHLGDKAEAQSLYHQAVDLIYAIAGRAAMVAPEWSAGQDLRASFLSTNEVQKVLRLQL